MLILYDFGLSPFAQKVKIALREKRLPFERRNGLMGEGAEVVRNLSPRGEVPLLMDGEIAIVDSTIILDYIDEKWPDPPLLPGFLERRAESRMFEEFSDTELEAIIYNLAELMSCKDGPAEVRKAVAEVGRADMARIQATLSERLRDNAFFDGDTIGRSDISLIPHMNAARVMRMEPVQDNLLSWLERMNARESVAETVAEVKQSLTDFKALMGKVQTGKAKRQMRDHRLDWLIRAGGLKILEARVAAENIRFAVL